MRLRLVVLLAMLFTAVSTFAQAKNPAVLFTSGLHLTYFAQPLHTEGIELHTCGASELPALLPTGKYNVVVITGGFQDPKVVEALKAFLEAGGGVLMTPNVRWSLEEYLANQHFLESYGAHFTMSTIQDSDPARKVAAMFTGLYSTETIAPPFNEGVPGLLYLAGGSQSGMSSPVSLVADAAWKPVVKASPTAQAVGWKEERVRDILPYVNAEPEPAPTLLAIRSVGKGYLAAISITGEWIFASPNNCPPVLDMLSRGRDGRPSNWLRLYANLFRYMAAPTLDAGAGGAPTPAAVLQPPPASDTLQGWASEMLKPRDWTKAPPIDDQDQLPGLIGARSSYSGGKGTVAEWVASARAAGLKYLVFLEPLEFTSEENFEKLKADCARASDDTFYACPGLWGKDVRTKTSMFTYGDSVQYPLATILTADRKYFDDTKTWADNQMPTKYIFDYFFEQLGYKGQFAYFRHKENPIPPWEYKMNNAFVVYSTENGKPLDDAFDMFSYLQATDFCYHPTVVSLMDDPAQLARAVKEDWRMVNVAPGEFGDGTYTEDYGQGLAAVRKLYSQQVAWLRPFQYITQGPTLNCWRGRWEIVIPFSEWYRPDQWRYRARLHVTSDAGLKEIVLMSAGQVYARFLPNGAKEFDKTLDFENSQQRAMYPIITDMNGKRAIGAYLRNSNTLWNEFICGDRCNFLSYGMVRTSSGQWHQIKPCGNGVTHNKGGWMAELSPATTLTIDYPTLPIDGAPQGQETPRFPMSPGIATPGFPEVSHINCRPIWGVSGPDVLIGGGSVDNIIVDKDSWGNAWSWWSPVQPNPFIEGYGMHTAFAPLPEGLRAGWYEFHLTARQDLPLTDPVLPVRFTSTGFTEFRDGDGHIFRAEDKPPEVSFGSFRRGAYVLVEAPGGPAALYSMDDNLVYQRRGQELTIGLKPQDTTIPKGAPITMKLGYLGAPSETDLEAFRHYFATLAGPLPLTATSPVTGDGIAVHLDGKPGSASLRFENLKLNAFLPVVMEGLPPNADAWIVDRTLKAPNWRQIVKKDGIAYAVLPCDAKKDYFIGCPVQAANPALHITLCNTLPQQWVVTLHNPTDSALTTAVWTARDWPIFALNRKAYTIPAGSSVEVRVQQR